VLTLKMSERSPGRELREEELPDGCTHVGPGSIFDATEAWYLTRRHWPSLTVVEVGEADAAPDGVIDTGPSLISSVPAPPPPAAVSEAVAREFAELPASYRELRAMCRDLGLKTNGSTNALRDRINAHLGRE